MQILFDYYMIIGLIFLTITKRLLDNHKLTANSGIDKNIKKFWN